MAGDFVAGVDIEQGQGFVQADPVAAAEAAPPGNCFRYFFSRWSSSGGPAQGIRFSLRVWGRSSACHCPGR